MRRFIFLLLLTAAAVAGVVAAAAQTSRPSDDAIAPILAGKLPPAYRDWKLISVAREEGELNDVRTILGNDTASNAYRDGTRPFPDGAIIARLAWTYVHSNENNKAFGRVQSFVAGNPKNGIQFMIKDSSRFAATGGWGYFQFDNGKPAPESMSKTCFPCHQQIKDRDFVFTNYAR